MQTKIVVTLLVALLAATGAYYQYNTTPEIDYQSIYQAWKTQFGKKMSNAEDKYRFAVFVSNAKYIEDHNSRFEQGLETVELGLTVFADLTVQEFEAQYLTRQKSSPTIYGSIHQVKGNQAPAEVDHRKSGIVSPVVNQGSCGGCWAFSAVGSLESALRQNGVTDVTLSEQELIDCARGTDYDSEGCDGGFSKDGIVYASKNGIAIKSEYPYTGVDGTCNSSKTKTRHSVSGYCHVTQNNAAAFVDAVSIKPLSAAINAGGINFQLYKSGIYTKNCDGAFDKLNHEILVVGYAPEYYIIKNSWGSSWGEQGYIRFGRISNPQGQCGVQQDAGYPVI